MYTEYTDEYSFSRPYLTPGESVLWKGRPEKGHWFTSQDIFMIPFSIMWCGFAIFWETTAIMSGAPVFFCLWGIPFVCVGLYLVVGRFFWSAYMRKRTFYVITNKKIIRLRGKRIDMLDGKTMPPMHMTANADGSGTIRFGQETYYRRGRTNSIEPSLLFTLENIPNVAGVHQIISNMER